MDFLPRAQFGKPADTERQASFGGQLGMWVQYFTWQWGHDLRQSYEAALAVVFGVLGVLGAIRHWYANRRHAIAMTVLMLTLTILLISYLNFKYGFSWDASKPTCGPVPTGDCIPREVRERDYFFICSFALWGIWVGMGLATVMEWLQDGLKVREPSEARRWAFASPVLLVAVVPLFANRLTASRHGETLARDFAVDLLQSVEPYGVLVTAGDNDTFPLWYAQEVEHIRQDVTVVNLSLANTDWYIRQLQRRPLATFDSTNAPAIYRVRSWPKPEGRLLSYSDTYVRDSLLPVYWLGEKQGVNLGGVAITLDPQQLGRQYLERADVIVLQAIKDQMGRRPIYFSRTVGPYADQFGLTADLEGQGFARKLHTEALAESDSIKIISVFGYVNVPRTENLAFNVYHMASAAHNRPRGWVDKPSEGILATYGLLYQSLGQVLRAKQPDLASKALVVADSVFKNTSYGFNPPAER